MSNINKKLFKRLHLNHAYGQLIALIFVPIAVLACVGAMLVMTETSNAAKAQQRQMALAILARYQPVAEGALNLMAQSPAQLDQARFAMQSMLNEKHLIRAAILDSKGSNRLNIGPEDQDAWPAIRSKTGFAGPIRFNKNTVYASKISGAAHAPHWLIVELDNQPLEIARYRVLIVLVATGLLTLREGCPHQVWCSEMVHQDLTSGFPLFNMLSHWNGGLQWNRVELEGSFVIDACPNLRFTPFPLRSAAPPYSPHRFDPHPGDNLGLLVEDTRTSGKLFYAPGLGQAHGEHGGGFALQRQVGQHVLHQRLVGQDLAADLAVRAVVRGLGQGLTHQAAGADHAVEAGHGDHFDDGRHAAALLADQPADGLVVFDLAAGVAERRFGIAAVANRELAAIFLDGVCAWVKSVGTSITRGR